MGYTGKEANELISRQAAKLAQGRPTNIGAIHPAGPSIEIAATVKFEPNKKMNKLKSAYGDLLEARKRAGEIVEYWFEGITLKLAHDCRYTPDYMVMLASGEIELHETKGFMRGDADVKLRVAAAMFPFKIYLIKRVKGEWDIRKVGAK